MSRGTTAVSVLAILPSQEDQASLNEIFCHSNWNVHFIEMLGHARILMEEVAAGVVISDCCLPDGGWIDVLVELQRRPLETPLIVASRLADERLWTEVLNRGGYDVLPIPFHGEEVVRSVSLAWRFWRDQRRAENRPPPEKVMTAGSASTTQLERMRRPI